MKVNEIIKMKIFWTSLVLCISFGAVVTKPQAQQAAASEVPESPVSLRNKRSYDRWLDIISQYMRRGSEGSPSPWQPFPVDLPIAGKDGMAQSLPVLVLPIPVPVPDLNSRQACDASKTRGESNKIREDTYSYREESNTFRDDKYRGSSNRNREEDRYRGSSKEDRYRGSSDRYREDRNRYKEENYQEERYEEYSNSSVTSDFLIKLFREQQPTGPELPPAVFDYVPDILQPEVEGSSSSGQRGYPPSNRGNSAPNRGNSQPNRGYLPVEGDTPPQPKFDRPLLMRGFLTVPKSDYTEPYTVWYDAESGNSKVDYHDGGAVTYRSMSDDGRRVQRFVRHTDRTEEDDVRVCGISSPSPATAEDRAPPGLPDMEQFSFGGYREEFGGRVEVWKRELAGRDGEGGAVRGERLTYRHEMVLSRGKDNFCMPLKYNVGVDSSVLGPDCDGYQHTYSSVEEKRHDTKIFKFNAEKQCDRREQLDAEKPEHMARLDPLREFSLPQRDKRHDVGFDSYVKEFERTYTDVKETAMRKTILTEQTRWVSSCNRQSGTFTVDINYLSDRLEAEIEVLLGVTFAEDTEGNNIKYPYSEGRISDFKNKLPKEFDWRPRGAVSPVKFQGTSCASCWAFAVAGSVEGALFIKTKTLVELSEQCLVDCGHSHEAHGCKGTWPPAAYNYVKDRGLPARDEYTPYAEKVLKCRDREIPPVTHISGYVDVPPENINALKVAIRRFAPSVVVVDAKAKSFIHYKKGVLQDDRCIKNPKKKLNHAVLAVGWGELKDEPHFIIKNSWHQAWGDGGYIKLHAPSNTCGHLTTPSFAQLNREDVDKLPAGARAAQTSDDDDFDDE